MPDPSVGLFPVVFSRGNIKVGKKTYELPDEDEPVVSVADLLSFVAEQVVSPPSDSRQFCVHLTCSAASIRWAPHCCAECPQGED